MVAATVLLAAFGGARECHGVRVPAKLMLVAGCAWKGRRLVCWSAARRWVLTG
ncbi:hypothetical protein FB475_1880 [Kribbella jejuensis]|uniref:Uncharacterized protein n=1 Tax=Kribbella jejuensis TaxID=236068 RepID=A0A542EQW0_9ACTN|nr:hypothetical protein FB475_1880 [Kribbella jejuensis]